MPDTSTAISCQRCGAELTRSDRRIQVAGAHQHRVANPGGFAFTIACFDTAAGCIAAHTASDEASWFSGYTWQRAFCRGCTWHVGWLFRQKNHVFYGLDCARAAESTKQ